MAPPRSTQLYQPWARVHILDSRLPSSSRASTFKRSAPLLAIAAGPDDAERPSLTHGPQCPSAYIWRWETTLSPVSANASSVPGDRDASEGDDVIRPPPVSRQPLQPRCAVHVMSDRAIGR